MNPTDLCLIYAPVIAVAVSLLKRIPFVSKNPKVVAAILAIALNVVGVAVVGDKASLALSLVKCILTSFGGSVAVYESGIKPLAAGTNV